jgi:hypothetical protein
VLHDTFRGLLENAEAQVLASAELNSLRVRFEAYCIDRGFVITGASEERLADLATAFAWLNNGDS